MIHKLRERGREWRRVREIHGMGGGGAEIRMVAPNLRGRVKEVSTAKGNGEKGLSAPAGKVWERRETGEREGGSGYRERKIHETVQ